MQKLVILLLCLSLCGMIEAGSHRLESSTINRALKAALTEIIENGEYEAIMNAHLGYGNYIIPSCNAGNDWPTEAPNDHSGGDDATNVFFGLRDILYRGQIRFAGDATAVFAYTDSTGRIVSGVEYDLGVAVARRISMHYGVLVEAYTFNTVEPGDIKFPALAKALYTGFPNPIQFNNDIAYEYDVIMGSLAKSPVRQKVVKFTDCPYFLTYLTGVRTGLDPLVLVSTVEDFNKEGVTIGVLYGSSAHQFAVSAIVPENYVLFDTETELIDALRSDGVHVVLAPNYQVQYFLQQSGCEDNSCHALGINLSTENYAFATRWLNSASTVATGLFALFAAFLVVLA